MRQEDDTTCSWHPEYACIIFPDPPKANEKGKSERVFTLPSRLEELCEAPPLLASILHLPANFLLKKRFTLPLCLWKMCFALRN